MKVFGIAGWSGSGKTTLITKLIPEIINRGRKVSTIKHTHHSFDIDKPGKDSHSHRLAGAAEVLVGSSQKWALIHEDRENKKVLLKLGFSRKFIPVYILITVNERKKMSCEL